VNAASRDQTGGIGAITDALEQIDQATRQMASGADQGAAASHELRRRSEALRSLVEELAAIVG
jgi:methyl-accepting chemotaxis protein